MIKSYIAHLNECYKEEFESKLDMKNNEIPEVLLDYYEASLGNNALASYDQDKLEINNVTFWFQLYLGSVKMIVDLKPEDTEVFQGKI